MLKSELELWKEWESMNNIYELLNDAQINLEEYEEQNNPTQVQPAKPPTVDATFDRLLAELVL